MNKKVPIATLSCFLIAFITQGILKMSGVFIFEKALSWQIFEIIDNSLYMSICYYSIINFIAVYCLCFALTSRPYSNKWYHYIIILVVSFGITCCRFLLTTPMFVEYVYDAIMYIVTPVLISLTTDRKYSLFEQKSFSQIIITISFSIILYFCYLGLNYWSGILNSIVAINQIFVYASSSFLIMFEVYIGLILLMLSLNCIIDSFKIKERNDMFWPMNIASKKAKLEAKKEKLLAEVAQIDEELKKL